MFIGTGNIEGPTGGSSFFDDPYSSLFTANLPFQEAQFEERTFYYSAIESPERGSFYVLVSTEHYGNYTMIPIAFVTRNPEQVSEIMNDETRLISPSYELFASYLRRILEGEDIYGRQATVNFISIPGETTFTGQPGKAIVFMGQEAFGFRNEVIEEWRIRQATREPDAYIQVGGFRIPDVRAGIRHKDSDPFNFMPIFSYRDRFGVDRLDGLDKPDRFHISITGRRLSPEHPLSVRLIPQDDGTFELLFSLDNPDDDIIPPPRPATRPQLRIVGAEARPVETTLLAGSMSQLFNENVHDAGADANMIGYSGIPVYAIAQTMSSLFDSVHMITACFTCSARGQFAVLQLDGSGGQVRIVDLYTLLYERPEEQVSRRWTYYAIFDLESRNIQAVLDADGKASFNLSRLAVPDPGAYLEAFRRNRKSSQETSSETNLRTGLDIYFSQAGQRLLVTDEPIIPNISTNELRDILYGYVLYNRTLRRQAIRDILAYRLTPQGNNVRYNLQNTLRYAQALGWAVNRIERELRGNVTLINIDRITREFSIDILTEEHERALKTRRFFGLDNELSRSRVRERLTAERENGFFWRSLAQRYSTHYHPR